GRRAAPPPASAARESRPSSFSFLSGDSPAVAPDRHDERQIVDEPYADEIGATAGRNLAAILQLDPLGRRRRYARDRVREGPVVPPVEQERSVQRACRHVVGREDVEQPCGGELGGRDVPG